MASLTCFIGDPGVFKRIVAATPEQLATIKTIVFESQEPDELDTLFSDCGFGVGPTLALRIAQHFIAPGLSETQFMLQDINTKLTRVFNAECDYSDGADLQALCHCIFNAHRAKCLVHLALEIDFIPHMLFTVKRFYFSLFGDPGSMPELQTLEIHLRRDWTAWPVSANIPPNKKVRARPSSGDNNITVPKLETIRLCAIGEMKKVSKSMVVRLAAALQLDNDEQKNKVTLELHSTRGVSIKGLEPFAKVITVERLVSPNELYDRYGHRSWTHDYY